MKNEIFKELGIVLGYKCNLTCAHCLTSSSPQQNGIMTDEEIVFLSEEIKFVIKHKGLEQIMFTGGEPTLYLSSINKLLSLLKTEIDNGLNIAMTSNGSFLKNDQKLNDFNQIYKISKLRISVDEFHQSGLDLEHLEKIRAICLNKKIELLINCVIGSPLVYIYKKACQNLAIRFSEAHLIYAGRGKQLKKNALYRRDRLMDLDHTCTLIDRVLYVPRRGFTRCTRNLTWNSLEFDDLIFAKNMSGLFSMLHYERLSKITFLEMKKGLEKVGNKKEFLNECDLCEEYHRCLT